MHRRTRRTLWILAAVLLLLAVAVFSAPRLRRRLRGCSPSPTAFIYINLKPVRSFLHKDLKPPRRDPEYQQFVDAPAFDWERDLDQVAIALHRMPDPKAPTGRSLIPWSWSAT
jgi:hypothetical protein